MGSRTDNTGQRLFLHQHKSFYPTEFTPAIATTDTAIADEVTILQCSRLAARLCTLKRSHLVPACSLQKQPIHKHALVFVRGGGQVGVAVVIRDVKAERQAVDGDAHLACMVLEHRRQEALHAGSITDTAQQSVTVSCQRCNFIIGQNWHSQGESLRRGQQQV